MFFQPFLQSLPQNRQGRKPPPERLQPLRPAARRRGGSDQGPRRHPPPHRQGMQRGAGLRRPQNHLPPPGTECSRLLCKCGRYTVADGKRRGGGKGGRLALLLLPPHAGGIEIRFLQ